MVSRINSLNMRKKTSRVPAAPRKREAVPIGSSQVNRSDLEGLQRAGVAESEWGDFLRSGGKKSGGFFKNLFGGGKK